MAYGYSSPRDLSSSYGESLRDEAVLFLCVSTLRFYKKVLPCSLVTTVINYNLIMKHQDLATREQLIQTSTVFANEIEKKERKIEKEMEERNGLRNIKNT